MTNEPKEYKKVEDYTLEELARNVMAWEEMGWQMCNLQPKIVWDRFDKKYIYRQAMYKDKEPT